MKRIYIFLFFVLLSFGMSAQVGVGDWSDHLSYASGKQVLQAGDKFFCITTGGMFSYDSSDNSLRKLNQINGLSDVQPSVMGYGEENNVVVVAYENGNLDLIYEQEIFNLSDIKRKQIQGDKKIYDVLVVGQAAYLSCGFGIVVVNLEKREIKDTYYIGENGLSVVVNDMAYDGTYLYAATNGGVYQADINNPNLQDFNNWNKIETIPHADDKFIKLEFFKGVLIACYADETSDRDQLYRNTGDTWVPFLQEVTKVNGLEVCGEQLVIAQEGTVGIYDVNGELTEEVVDFNYPDRKVYDIQVNHAICDDEGSIWMADEAEGLVRNTGGTYEQIIPEGPVDNRVFSMYANGEDLWVASGGRSDAWGNVWLVPQAQLFRNGEWSAFNRKTHDEFNEFHDLVNIVADPADADHVFFGTWGAGVVEMQGGEFVARYNQYNSSLQTALPTDPSPNFVRIGGMAFDSQNNLWVTNSQVSEPLSVHTPDGKWESFALDGVEGKDIGDLVIADNGDQWIIVPRGNNLFVRKADGSDGKHLQLISYFTNSVEEKFVRMNDIYSIATDHDGAIWVGTSVGVAVYFNPENIWEQSPFYATQPGLDLDDGIYHPLLENETVTAIAVDGANRKWLGTKSSGVFLVSADGQDELKSFNESNSPLLSNTIQSIAINDKTGEVFFGTPDGIISYRGEATAGGNQYADVYAFPNPVRENYDGDIVITGLIADTDVKITDISGNLVHQTTSLGGQAVWDGKNLNGNRVSTGVYMVFGNDKSGEKTFATKILFIH